MAAEYRSRAVRYGISLPVEFLSDGHITAGQCVNVSTSGLFGDFEDQLDVWTVGELRLHVGERSHKVGARVARVEGRSAGLAFRYASSTEREKVSAILDELLGTLRRVGTPFTPPF